jgi:micrococcal nuclease
MLDERMVADGYAQLLSIPPNVRYVERLVAAITSAREQDLGLWAACVSALAPLVLPGEPVVQQCSLILRGGLFQHAGKGERLPGQ